MAKAQKKSGLTHGSSIREGVCLCWLTTRVPKEMGASSGRVALERRPPSSTLATGKRKGEKGIRSIGRVQLGGRRSILLEKGSVAKRRPAAGPRSRFSSAKKAALGKKARSKKRGDHKSGVLAVAETDSVVEWGGWAGYFQGKARPRVTSCLAAAASSGPGSQKQGPCSNLQRQGTKRPCAGKEKGGSPQKDFLQEVPLKKEGVFYTITNQQSSRNIISGL